jgi:hypothetical protein
MIFTVTSTTETGEIRRSKIRASNAEFAYEDACYSLGPNESILSIICENDNDSIKSHRNMLHANERRGRRCLKCNNPKCQCNKSK